MAEIDNLQIRISADTMKAINAINKLTRSMDKLKTTIGSGIGFDELARQTNSFARAIKNHLNVLERYATAMERIAKASRSMPKVTERAVKKTEGAKGSGDMPLLEGTKTMPATDANAVSVSTKQNKQNKQKPLRAEVDKTNKATSLLLKTLKRMLLYMAIRTVIQNFIKSMKAGTDAIYRYSQATESASEKSKAFIKTMDALESAALRSDVAWANFRANFSDLELAFKENWANIMSQSSEGWSRAFAFLKGEETYWGVNTEAVKKYEGALKSLTSQYDELNTLSNANNVDYSELLVEKDVKTGAVVGELRATAKVQEELNEKLEAQKKLQDDIAKKQQTELTMTGKISASTKTVFDNLKDVNSSMDIFNQKKLDGPLSELSAYNDKMRESIALTIELANITSMHTSSSGVLHGGGGKSDSTINSASSRVIKGNLGGGGLGTAMVDLQAYAGGGFLDSGELFVARENGLPEMVGTIGGAGAVANNADIVAAIAQGVADAITSGRMAVSVENFEGPARSLLKTLDNSATMRRLGGL